MQGNRLPASNQKNHNTSGPKETAIMSKIDAKLDLPLAASPSTSRPTYVRYVVLFFILLATIISYVDRTNLGIAAPFMSKELALDKAQMGQIFAAFGLTYAFALIPGGYIADMFGSRLTYAAALVGWSLATMIQGVASSFNTLFGARLAIGVLESPAFPANARAVTMWFPIKERGFATSVYIMGQYIGTPLFAGLLLWLAQTEGWRTIFYVTGGAGVLLGLLWYFVYQDPMQSRFANPAELAHIEAGGGLASNKERTPFDWTAMFRLLQQRQVLAICLGKFCSNTILVFFTTWFLTFLIEERKMTMIKVGFFQVLPFVGATAGILLAGFLSDFFIRRGVSMSAARKTPLIIGSLLASVIVLINFVTSDAAVIGILTVAFFAQGVASSSWAAVSEIAPRQYIGLTSGTTSLAANLAGISTPLAIGYILQATGSFYWALNFMGIVCLVGTFSYSFLLGRLHRIEM
jgi:MFS transporter, ACS family, D-galactonate transporter